MHWIFSLCVCVSMSDAVVDTNTHIAVVYVCPEHFCMTIGDRWQQMVPAVIKTYESRTSVQRTLANQKE